MRAQSSCFFCYWALAGLRYLEKTGGTSWLVCTSYLGGLFFIYNDYWYCLIFAIDSFFYNQMNYLITVIFELGIKFQSKFDASHFIVGVVGFSQGIQHLADLSIQYMFKDDFGISPARMGVYMSLIAFPWIIKPLWGIFTDSKPLFGYRRKSYLIIFGFFGGIGWLCLAFYGMDNIYAALGILTMIQFCVCFTNVVGEAILVELSGQKNEEQQRDENLNEEEQQKNFQRGASRNVSLFFGVRAVGTLISAYFSGAILLWFSKKQVFMMTSVFPFILTAIALFYKEERVNVAELEGSDRRVNSRQCLIDFWEFFKNPLIYKPVVLIFCFMMCPSSGAIMFYFYTNVLQFSPQFLGQLKFMYAIGALAGVFIYNSYLKEVRFRNIFITTTVLYFFCYQSLIILVTRKNVEWGINDKFFCIGDSVMLQLVAELNLMPILVLACRMCPKNIEGTMYAMLMSTINMGALMGAQWGALFLVILGVSHNDYSRLPLFIFLTGLCLLLPLPFVGVVKESEILRQREQRMLEQFPEKKLDIENEKVSSSGRESQTKDVDAEEDETGSLMRK